MNETSTLLIYLAAWFFLGGIPLLLALSAGSKHGDIALCALLGLFLGWIGYWIVVAHHAEKRRKEERAEAAQLARVRQQMAAARGDYLD